MVRPMEGTPDDASRRTWLAHERTVLAWWRTALAAIAVALGVGRLLPSLLDVGERPFVILGVGYGILAVGLVAYGAVHHRAVKRALEAGSMHRLDDRAVIAFTIGLIVLAGATTVLVGLGN
jgi:uncharacterized membrane protein YidH (DUF202 family)